KYSAENLLASDSLAPNRRALLEGVRGHAVLSADSDALALWRCVATMLLKQDGELYLTVNARHGFPTTNRDMKSRTHALLKSLSGDEEACERLVELRSEEHTSELQSRE